MIFVAWVGFWNLGIIALSICVLAGCRSKMESNYSVMNWPRSTLTLIWGEECGNATADLIPDIYRLGVSGTCRVWEEGTYCSSRFPPSINLARVILEDLAEANVTENALLQKCQEAIDKPWIKHGAAETLGKVMVGFIIVTIILCLVSFAASFADGGIGPITTGILAFDVLLIFGSVCLVIAIGNLEGGGYLSGVHGGDFSDRQMIGIGMWMMAAMLLARVLSSPWLTLSAIIIILPIVLVFLVFLVRTRGFFWVVRAYMESDISG